MSEERKQMVDQRAITQRIPAVVGAAAWILLAVAWQISDLLERSQPFEGAPRVWFLVGLAAGTIGGLALLVEALRSRGARSGRFVAGIVAVVLAIGLQALAGWALPVWAVAYGFAALLLLPNLRPGGALVAGGFLGSVAVWIGLESVGLGPVDEFGDHPVAWFSATWLLALAVAAGLIVRYRASSRDELVEASVSV